MNSTTHGRSIHPNANGWRTLSRFAAPLFQPPKVSFQLVSGVGDQAHFLQECFQSLIRAEWDEAKELGWGPPPAAHIHVALAGSGDADWSLEPEETKF